MGKQIRFLFYAFVLTLITVANLSCSGKVKAKTDDSGSTSTPTTPPVATSAKPLVLKIFTKYLDTEYKNSLNFQETGTDECSVSATSPVATCTVTVPEGRLYFSSLNFQFAWMSGDCKLLTFQPYYYQASNSAAYLPPGSDSTIDCTATPIPAECFAGPARDVVSSFPRERGLIYLPDETTPSVALSEEVTVQSAYAKRFFSNRWTVNDIAVGKRGTTASSADLGGTGDGYIANTFVDYSFSCRDDWYDPITYTINLNVRDEDSASGAPVNDFYTWKEWP